MIDLYELYENIKNEEPKPSVSNSDSETSLVGEIKEVTKQEGDMFLFNEFRTFKKNLYDDTKIERVNKKELLLPKYQLKLFKITGEKAQEYTKILKTINAYDKILAADSNFDFKYFELDKGGCDPRIMDIIPEYLDKHIIIASSHQKNMDILRNNYSFLEPMLDEILDGRAKDTIAAVTPYEILFGELNTGLETLVKQINFGAKHLVESGYFEISLDLDTHNNSINKMVDIRNKVLDIMDIDTQGVSKILNYDLEDEILKESRELNKIYVDISKFVLGEGDFVIDNIFPLKIKTNSYKYSNEDMDIYSFKNGKYVFIYFESGEKKAKTTFLDEKNYLVLNGNDPAMMLSKLHENNIIDFNLSPKYIKEKMMDIEKKNFEQYVTNTDKNINSLPDMIIDSKKDSKTTFHSPLFLELESTLKELELNNMKDEKTYMKTKSIELRLALMYPTIQDRLVYELLAKLNKDENIMTYTWDAVNFKKKFSSGTDAEKNIMLQEVLNGVKYVEQYNLEINNWLFKNYKPICDKLSVQFESN